MLNRVGSYLRLHLPNSLTPKSAHPDLSTQICTPKLTHSTFHEGIVHDTIQSTFCEEVIYSVFYEGLHTQICSPRSVHLNWHIVRFMKEFSIVRFVRDSYLGFTHQSSSMILFIVRFVKELYFSSTHKKKLKNQNFKISKFFMFSHGSTSQGSPSRGSTYPATGHNLYFHPRYSWQSSLARRVSSKQSCHQRRPGGVFHPLVLRRSMHNVLTHTSTHYTIDDSSWLNTT